MADPGWLRMGDPAWLTMGDPGWLSFPDPGGSLWGGRWQYSTNTGKDYSLTEESPP